MARTGRPGLSPEQKSRIWEGWHRGESISYIGRELGKHPASVFGVLKASGGIMPLARCRSDRVLSLEEREVITRGIAAGSSLHAIARTLGRPPPRLAGKLCETAVVSITGPSLQIGMRGLRLAAPSLVCWRSGQGLPDGVDFNNRLIYYVGPVDPGRRQ